MINAVERAVDIARAEQVAKHHYLDVAWKFAREALGTKGPYEHTTTLGVRHREERRSTLERAWRTVSTATSPRPSTPTG